MDAIIQHASTLHGTLTMPADKAICHRVVLAAALASGRTEIRPWPAADDCQRTLQVVTSLGIAVSRSGDCLRIEGRGVDGLCASTQDLFCGESGTTLRLASGLLAGQPWVSRLSAGPQLSQRPMRRIVSPLSQMGVQIDGALTTASEEIRPPLTIHGRRPLRAICYEMPVASAQVKSAILLAGLFADGPTTVIERQPTRDHTERTLRRFGLDVRSVGGNIIVKPGPFTAPGTLVIPGDISSAAFFLVAASCIPDSRVVFKDIGLNPTRAKLLDVLQRMGASIQSTVTDESWEPRGTLTVEARPLRAIMLEPHEVPGLIDELPILMVAAACAQGLSRFHGVGELRVKETDRIQSMVNGLGRLGVAIRVVEAETIEIDGGPLTGATVEGAGDHRTAMSLAVAGLLAKGGTTLRGAECVAKSFPEFFDRLRLIAGSSTVKTVDSP